jgi:hypothetical protein
MMYPNFFMLSSSVGRGLNIERAGTFPGNPKRILNNRSARIARNAGAAAIGIARYSMIA